MTNLQNIGFQAYDGTTFDAGAYNDIGAMFWEFPLNAFATVTDDNFLTLTIDFADPTPDADVGLLLFYASDGTTTTAALGGDQKNIPAGTTTINYTFTWTGTMSRLFLVSGYDFNLSGQG